MKTNDPQSITTNNTTHQTSLAPIDPKGRQLRQTMEHLTLERMIEQLRQEELDPDTLCKMLHTYCELRKQDAAAEKNRVALQIAQQPKRTPLNAGPHAGPRIPSRSNPNHPFDDCPDDPEPAYSKSPSDQPGPLAASHKNFRRTLREAVADIYGINLDIDPKPKPKPSPPADDTHAVAPRANPSRPSNTTTRSRAPPPEAG